MRRSAKSMTSPNGLMYRKRAAFLKVLEISPVVFFFVPLFFYRNHFCFFVFRFYFFDWPKSQSRESLGFLFSVVLRMREIVLQARVSRHWICFLARAFREPILVYFFETKERRELEKEPRIANREEPDPTRGASIALERQLDVKLSLFSFV